MIDTSVKSHVDPAVTSVIQDSRVPGLSFTIPAGTELRSDLDGSLITDIAITSVSSSRIPLPPPGPGLHIDPGTIYMMYFFKPGGAIPTQKITQFSLPNDLGSAPAGTLSSDLAGNQPFFTGNGFVQVFSVDAANQPVAFIGSISTSLLGISSATIAASPATLTANGTSTATITVTVRDRNGTLAPDGTRVGLTAAPIFSQTSAGGTIVNGTTSPTDPRVQIFTTTGGQFTATYRSPTSRGSGTAAVQAVTVDPQGHPTYLINSVTITLQ